MKKLKTNNIQNKNYLIYQDIMISAIPNAALN